MPLVGCEFVQRSLFSDRVDMCSANSFNNNNRQVSDTAGTWLSTNTVSLMHRAFCCGHILGTMQLVLASGK